jgi:hypothetical protein
MNKNDINRKVIKTALEYCVETFGLSKYNGPIPNIIIKRTRVKDDKRCRGQYDSTNNTIIVIPVAHSSFIDVINTIIHEYTHYLQDLGIYSILYRSFGYWDHPQEIEADKIATEYQWRCKNYIKERMSK